MQKHKKDILILIIIILYVGVLVNFSNADNDLIWNYGFSYNIANNLTMYKDFNMVITPLYPFICSVVMKLLGNNFLIFNLTNILLLSSMYFYIYKKYPKTFILSIILISFILRPSYNFLIIFLLLILLNLDEDKDFLIGFILGLITLTKQSFIILTIPCIIYIKSPYKILKRLGAFLIPIIVLGIYLATNNALHEFINYTLLGLFSFGSKNSFINLGTFLTILLIGFLTIFYVKHKDLKILYLITYQIMAYPIFNTMHILFSIIPVVIYFLDYIAKTFNFKNNNYNYLKYINYLGIILLICPIFSTFLQYHFKDLTKGINALKYKDINKQYLDNAKSISKEISNLDKTYFIMYDAYIYKFLLNQKINNYDLLLNGNMGYNGEKRTIDYFKSLDKDTYFLLNEVFEGGQLSKEIDSFIRNNYVKIKTFNGLVLYKKQ